MYSEYRYEYYNVSRDISVGIAPRLGLDHPGIESRCGARFSVCFETGPDSNPASYLSLLGFSQG
jgi:hypothetical protein